MSRSITNRLFRLEGRHGDDQPEHIGGGIYATRAEVAHILREVAKRQREVIPSDGGNGHCGGDGKERWEIIEDGKGGHPPFGSRGCVLPAT